MQETNITSSTYCTLLRNVSELLHYLRDEILFSPHDMSDSSFKGWLDDKLWMKIMQLSSQRIYSAYKKICYNVFEGRNSILKDR